jgi:hypothetical protein
MNVTLVNLTNGEHHRFAGENVSIKTRVMATPVHAFVRQLCYRA